MTKPRIIDVFICPFCKGKNMTVMRQSSNRGTGYVVDCDNCGASGPFANTALKAQMAWNQYPFPSTVSGVNKPVRYRISGKPGRSPSHGFLSNPEGQS